MIRHVMARYPPNFNGEIAKILLKLTFLGKNPTGFARAVLKKGILVFLFHFKPLTAIPLEDLFEELASML